MSSQEQTRLPGYLEPIISDKRLLRERALMGLEDLFYLAADIIGLSKDEFPRTREEIGPYYEWLSKPRPPHLGPHRIWLRFFSIFRYFAKTYGMAVWLLREIILNPDIAIIIDGQEKANAVDTVRLIRDWLDDPEIVRLYGRFKGDTWNLEEGLIVSQRQRARKDPTLRAMGLDVPEQGKRCDIRVWDDLIGKTNNNDEGILKVERHLSASVPIIRPGGLGLYLCTRWNPYDPSTDKHTISGQPGILKLWKDTGLWDAPPPRGWFGAYAQEGDDIFFPHVKPGDPICPSVLPEEKIEELRLITPHGVFNSQYMNDPIPEDTRYFSEKDIQYFEHRDSEGNIDERLRGSLPFISLDLAGGKTKTPGGDDTAFCVFYIRWFDDFFHVYIVEWKGGRWKPDRIQNTLFDLFATYKPRKIYPEVNVGREYFIEPIKKRAADLGLYLPIDEVNQSVFGTGKKDERIAALQPLYAQHRVFHATHLKNSKAEEQLLRWTKDGAGHDDYPDALATGVFMATKKKFGMGGQRTAGKVLSSAPPVRYSRTNL